MEEPDFVGSLILWFLFMAPLVAIVLMPIGLVFLFIQNRKNEPDLKKRKRVEKIIIWIAVLAGFFWLILEMFSI
jgi:hypothetical protein